MDRFDVQHHRPGHVRGHHTGRQHVPLHGPTFGGSVFACGAQPTVGGRRAGAGGPNQWNANGFQIDFTTQNGGTAFLNHDFAMRSLDGHGVPGCRPTVSSVLTGAFNTAYTSFNGAVTTTLEPGSNPGTANALISLTKGSSRAQ